MLADTDLIKAQICQCNTRWTLNYWGISSRLFSPFEVRLYSLKQHYISSGFLRVVLSKDKHAPNLLIQTKATRIKICSALMFRCYIRILDYVCQSVSLPPTSERIYQFTSVIVAGLTYRSTKRTELKLQIKYK